MQTQKDNLFVCIEGIDGCGKSTQAAMLVQALEELKINNQSDFNIVHSRQPGGTVVGEAIRSCIMQSKPTGNAIINMMFATRSDYTDNVFDKTKNTIFIIERWSPSTFVYNINDDKNKALFDFLHDTIKNPDLYIYLDIDPKTAYERVMKERGIGNFLDEGDIDTYINRYNRYKQYFDKYQPPVVKIDATQSVNKVHNDIMKIFVQYFK